MFVKIHTPFLQILHSLQIGSSDLPLARITKSNKNGLIVAANPIKTVHNFVRIKIHQNPRDIILREFDTRGHFKPLCLLWMYVKFMFQFALYYVVRIAVPTALYLKHKALAGILLALHLVYYLCSVAVSGRNPIDRDTNTEGGCLTKGVRWKTCSVVPWQSSRSFWGFDDLFCCCLVLFVCYSGVEGVLAIQKQSLIHIFVKHHALAHLAQSPYQSAVLTSATA